MDNKVGNKAVISVSRATTTNKILFMSNIKHDRFISIKIKLAENDNLKDYAYPKETLVEVHMSPTQWSDLLSNMNTIGIPCTLDYLKDTEIINEVEISNNLEKKYKKGFDFLEKVKTEGLLKNLRETIEKSKLSKKDKIKIEVLTRNLDTLLKAEAAFYLEEFEEEADKLVLESKAKVEANKNFVIETLGLNKLEELKLLNS